jgi:Nitroreductase
MSTLPRPEDHRTADHPIEPVILRRWSPRAMSGEPLEDREIRMLFEAARWAPSSYNEQEWRFLYARRDTPQWRTFFDLLVEGNQAWCHRAALLVLIAAKRTFTLNGKPNSVHLFDCGCAFENLAIQGTAMGLIVHAMAGYDPDKARISLRLPDDYVPAAMFAAGRPGNPEELPEGFRETEIPSGRKSLEEITCEGPFAWHK